MHDIVTVDAAATLPINLGPFGISHGGRPPSKHATEPGKGRVRIAKDSGLRKLMRAANRGKIPAERLRVILQAMLAVANAPSSRYAHATWRSVSVSA